MKDVKLMPEDWADYEGDYEKIQYDVMLHNGSIVKCCWPNAGKFLELVGKCREIDGIHVKQFRKAQNPSY